ncbi:MAG: O-antigen ligase family protein [Patescibacteria group bacterium]
MNKLTKNLILATVFLIPSYLVKFSIFGIPTNVLEILIYLTFISYLFEKPHISWKELYKNYKVYIFPIALIFLGLILSTLINQNYREGFGIIKGWFFDPLLFSFVLINTVKNKKDIENIEKSFYLSAFLVGIAALQYFFFGNLTYDGRLSSFYSSPNYLAMFLAPAVFIGACFLKTKKFIMIFPAAIIIFVIYLTYSYATWTAIILSLLIVAFITKNISKKFILISLTIILIAFLIQTNNPKLKDIFSERSSLNSRSMIWKSSVLMIKNNFIFGIGPGNFQNKYLEYQKYFPPYLEWAVPEPHNLYLAFWLESGLIGLISFISLIYIWLKKMLKNSHFTAVPFGIILYILIHGIADTTYWKNDLSLIFWIFFSLGLLQIYSIKLSVGPVDKK